MLKIENVSYRYKGSDRDVLCQVSAEMEAGKLYAVVGPSGSGKTTLLSMMAGLDAPNRGHIFIEDEDLSALNRDTYRRSKISMLFQAFQLFPLLTARENVQYPLETSGTVKKEAHARASALLESVGIDGDKQKRFPANLSGGEQQRVAIARSLATGAKLLLADEPTGNLDAANGAAVINILKELAHERGYCVVVVTHNLEIAAASDVVFRMADGRLKKG